MEAREEELCECQGVFSGKNILPLTELKSRQVRRDGRRAGVAFPFPPESRSASKYAVTNSFYLLVQWMADESTRNRPWIIKTSIKKQKLATHAGKPESTSTHHHRRAELPSYRSNTLHHRQRIRPHAWSSIEIS